MENSRGRYIAISMVFLCPMKNERCTPASIAPESVLKVYY
jgi:hypothetical protein